jgi:hypothetical protein
MWQLSIKKGASYSPLFNSVNLSVDNYYLLTVSLSALPAVKAGALRAAILSSLPVCGLRPVRAARCDTLNVPKPIKVTESPFLSEEVIAATVASIARPADAFERSADLATASINSDLFMYYSSGYCCEVYKIKQPFRIKGYFTEYVNQTNRL